MIRFHLHGYGEFDAHRRIGPSVWPHFDLLFVHDGHVQLRLRERDAVELRSGECILIDPHTPFRGHTVSPRTRASVQHFALDRRSTALHPPFDALAGRTCGFQTFGAVAGKRIEADVARAMQLAVLDDAPAALVREMRIANLTLILAELSHPLLQSAYHGGGGGDADQAFGPVLAWAEENLGRSPTVAQLARRAGLSCSHFRGLFTHRLGRSPGAWLMDLRLREASRLLRETRMPIKQVAQHVGYANVATFHHAFHRRNQMTPARYRARFAPSG